MSKEVPDWVLCASEKLDIKTTGEKKACIMVNILCTQHIPFKEKLIIFLISSFYILYIL